MRLRSLVDDQWESSSGFDTRTAVRDEKMLSRKCDNLAVLQAVKTLENWSEVARQHGISRERVRQIAAAHGIRKRPNFEEAMLLIHPFMKYADKSSCWRCGREMREAALHLKVCDACRKRLRAISLAKHHLRTFMTLGSHYSLVQAAHLIRKNRLLPGDFS
jgi:hypothetical protein